VKVCNDYMFGSLSCSMTVKEETEEVEKTIANLRYGCIGVNVWSGLIYGVTGFTWGAFPGEKLESIESGIGQINNFFMIPNIEKCVYRVQVFDALAQQEREENMVGFINKLNGVCAFMLKPGVHSFLSLLFAIGTGKRLPSSQTLISGFVLGCALVATPFIPRLMDTNGY